VADFIYNDAFTYFSIMKYGDERNIFSTRSKALKVLNTAS